MIATRKASLRIVARVLVTQALVLLPSLARARTCQISPWVVSACDRVAPSLPHALQLAPPSVLFCHWNS